MRYVRKYDWVLLMPQDHYVSYRSEESIARLAYRLRDAHGSREKPSFNIVDFVTHTLGEYLKGQKKGALKIEFYDREFKEDDPAYVSFDPLTLNVDRKSGRTLKQAKNMRDT